MGWRSNAFFSFVELWMRLARREFATTLPIVNISMPLEASLSTGVLWAENMFTR